MASAEPPAPAGKPSRSASEPHSTAAVAVRQGERGMTIVTVETDRVRPEARAQLYAMALNGLLHTKTLTPDPHATVHGFFLGPLQIVFGEATPRVSQRTRALCTRDRFDGIALLLVRAGAWRGRIAGRAAAGGAGTLMLFDLAQTFTITDEIDREFVMVVAPRSIAARLAADPAELHGRAIDVTDGAVLASFMNSLAVNAASLRAADGAPLAEVLLSLIGIALSHGHQVLGRVQPDEADLIRDRVMRLISIRISADDLTPEWIAAKLGISRSRLYAAFTGGEGVARRIWDRRLTAARDALSDPTENGTIGAIAGRFGFASEAHFSRAFRRKFGITPTDARRGTAS